MATVLGSLEEMLKDRWVLCLCVAPLICSAFAPLGKLRDLNRRRP